MVSSAARWQNLIPSFSCSAAGWRAGGQNPRKGRDQILQRSAEEPLSLKPKGPNAKDLKIRLQPPGNGSNQPSLSVGFGGSSSHNSSPGGKIPDDCQ